jgi:tripartite-type tricarboxylate transporter receptor subunit TctC
MFMRLVYLLLTLIPGCALAQGAGWKPDRPVELIIGAAPGGANDRIGRALQRGLQDGKVANPVVVMNKPGGGTAVTLRDVTPVDQDTRRVPGLFCQERLSDPHREGYRRSP